VACVKRVDLASTVNMAHVRVEEGATTTATATERVFRLLHAPATIFQVSATVPYKSDELRSRVRFGETG
jgi:hypothetical protein